MPNKTLLTLYLCEDKLANIHACVWETNKEKAKKQFIKLFKYDIVDLDMISIKEIKDAVNIKQIDLLKNN